MMVWGIWILVIISAGNFFYLMSIYEFNKEENLVWLRYKEEHQKWMKENHKHY